MKKVKGLRVHLTNHHYNCSVRCYKKHQLLKHYCYYSTSVSSSDNSLRNGFEYSQEDYKKFTLLELKTVLKQKHLKFAGNKPILIKRFIDASIPPSVLESFATTKKETQISKSSSSLSGKLRQNSNDIPQIFDLILCNSKEDAQQLANFHNINNHHDNQPGLICEHPLNLTQLNDDPLLHSFSSSSSPSPNPIKLIFAFELDHIIFSNLELLHNLNHNYFSSKISSLPSSLKFNPSLNSLLPSWQQLPLHPKRNFWSWEFNKKKPAQMKSINSLNFILPFTCSVSFVYDFVAKPQNLLKTHCILNSPKLIKFPSDNLKVSKMNLQNHNESVSKGQEEKLIRDWKSSEMEKFYVEANLSLLVTKVLNHNYFYKVSIQDLMHNEQQQNADENENIESFESYLKFQNVISFLKTHLNPSFDKEVSEEQVQEHLFQELKGLKSKLLKQFGTDEDNELNELDENRRIGSCISCHSGKIIEKKKFYICENFKNLNSNFPQNHSASKQNFEKFSVWNFPIEAEQEEAKEQDEAEKGVKPECNFMVWKNLCKREIKREEMKDLLKYKKTNEVLKGFVSKKGVEFEAFLFLKEEPQFNDTNGNGGMEKGWKFGFKFRNENRTGKGAGEISFGAKRPKFFGEDNSNFREWKF